MIIVEKRQGRRLHRDRNPACVAQNSRLGEGPWTDRLVAGVGDVRRPARVSQPESLVGATVRSFKVRPAELQQQDKEQNQDGERRHYPENSCDPSNGAAWCKNGGRRRLRRWRRGWRRWGWAGSSSRRAGGTRRPDFGGRRGQGRGSSVAGSLRGCRLWDRTRQRRRLRGRRPTFVRSIEGNARIRVVDVSRERRRGRNLVGDED